MLYSNLNSEEIYLDASATTPPCDDVIRTILQVQQDCWGNPSSIHNIGIKSSEILERSRKLISTILSSEPNELIFTSGSTESIHLALLGMFPNISNGRIVISSVEHPSVISAAETLRKKGWEVVYWPVDHLGMVKLDLMEEIITPSTKLVSIIWGQSEIGTLQPINEIGKYCQEHDIIFHTDATQILLTRPVEWNKLNVDLLSASSHKFLGPKGSGILLCRKHILENLSPLFGGGGQENYKRSGTESVALIAGMAKALEIVSKICLMPDKDRNINDFTKITVDLREELANNVNLRFTGHPIHRLSNHISMIVSTINGRPIAGRALVRVLSEFKIFSSSGSACQSGQIIDSHILSATGVEQNWRQSGLRFSMGPWLDSKQVERVPDFLQKAITQLS